MSWELRVSPELSQYCEELARQVAPQAEAVIREELESYKAQLVQQWPVGDGKPEGHSKDKFRVRVVLTPQGVRGVLENTASYAAYIKEKWPNKGNVARKLFFAPSDEMALRVAKRLAGRVG